MSQKFSTFVHMINNKSNIEMQQIMTYLSTMWSTSMLPSPWKPSFV